MNASSKNKSIWTIGHSTRGIDELVAMLHSFKIKMVADIRSFPGSYKYPQFNKEVLAITLPENNIHYTFLIKLGGRRKVKLDSKNTLWRNAAFRGYADYMETDAFKEEIKELETIGLKQRTAFMCSEAVWWRCHRSMVSDYLKVQGWKIMHIMGMGKEDEHPYTAPARIINGTLSYEMDITHHSLPLISEHSLPAFQSKVYHQVAGLIKVFQCKVYHSQVFFC